MRAFTVLVAWMMVFTFPLMSSPLHGQQDETPERREPVPMTQPTEDPTPEAVAREGDREYRIPTVVGAVVAVILVASLILLATAGTRARKKEQDRLDRGGER